MSNDALKDFMRHDNDNESWLLTRPICENCKEHIQDDEAYNVFGMMICKRCMNDMREEIED